MESLSVRFILFPLLNLLPGTQGIPTISSSIQPLSDELCPGTVTFLCTLLDSGSPVIEWYISNTRHVRYDYSPHHAFPYLVGISTPGLMAQITSVTFRDPLYRYFNFTLSVDLNDILQYEGLNLTCGTILLRSKPIPIGNFVIKEVTVNRKLHLLTSIIYYGYKKILTRISVKWLHQVSECPCRIPAQYSVDITNGNELLWRTQLSASECIGRECSVYFTPKSQWNVRWYEVTVMATCDNATTINNVIISSNLDPRIADVIKNKDNSISVSCGHKTDNNCFINCYTTSSVHNITLVPGLEYTITQEQIVPYDYLLEVETVINSTTYLWKIILSVDPERNLTSLLISLPFIVIFSIVFMVIIVLLSYFTIKYFRKRNEKKSCISCEDREIKMETNQVYGEAPQKLSGQEESIQMNRNIVYGCR